MCQKWLCELRFSCCEANISCESHTCSGLPGSSRLHLELSNEDEVRRAGTLEHELSEPVESRASIFGTRLILAFAS